MYVHVHVMYTSCMLGHWCASGVDTATPSGSHTGDGGECPIGHYCPGGDAIPIGCPAGYYQVRAYRGCKNLHDQVNAH